MTTFAKFEEGWEETLVLYRNEFQTRRLLLEQVTQWLNTLPPKEVVLHIKDWYDEQQQFIKELDLGTSSSSYSRMFRERVEWFKMLLIESGFDKEHFDE